MRSKELTGDSDGLHYKGEDEAVEFERRTDTNITEMLCGYDMKQVWSYYGRWGRNYSTRQVQIELEATTIYLRFQLSSNHLY